MKSALVADQLETLAKEIRAGECSEDDDICFDEVLKAIETIFEGEL